MGNTQRDGYVYMSVLILAYYSTFLSSTATKKNV